MVINLLDRIGDRNPQLFRELKGRFKYKSISLSIFASLMLQFALIQPFVEKTCSKIVNNQCFDLVWKIQWEYIFKTLDWMLPIILLVLGVYLIVEDVAKEEKRGTLNFIRLSPQTSQSILLGKILGVPSLIYLAVALAIPLHFVSAINDGKPFFIPLIIYSFWGIGCFLFFSIGLLYTLVNSQRFDPKTLAGGMTIVALLGGLMYVGLIDGYWANFQPSNWQWFFLPIGQKPGLAYGLMLISFTQAAYWFWVAVNRLFRNSKASCISKKQSYWLVGNFQFLLLGFGLSELTGISSTSGVGLSWAFLLFLTPILLIFLMIGLSSDRQLVLDWARYRRDKLATRHNFWKSSLWQDLIWDEKSPVIIAIAVNILITIVVWLPWFLSLLAKFEVEPVKIGQAILGLILSMNIMLIYAAIADLRLFLNPQKQGLWMINAMFCIFMLISSSFFLGNKNGIMEAILIFSPFPMFVVAFSSLTTIMMGLIAQLSILGFLSYQLNHKLRQAGESDSKVLLASADFPR